MLGLLSYYSKFLPTLYSPGTTVQTAAEEYTMGLDILTGTSISGIKRAPNVRVL